MNENHRCRNCFSMMNIRKDLAADVRKVIRKLSRDPGPTETASLKTELENLKMRVQLNAKTIRDHLDEVEFAD